MGKLNVGNSEWPIVMQQQGYVGVITMNHGDECGFILFFTKLCYKLKVWGGWEGDGSGSYQQGKQCCIGLSCLAKTKKKSQLVTQDQRFLQMTVT
jgi:hypothetical protein